MIALSPLPLCKGKPSLFCNQKTTNVLKCWYNVKLGPPPPNQLMILGVHDKWDAYETWRGIFHHLTNSGKWAISWLRLVNLNLLVFFLILDGVNLTLLQVQQEVTVIRLSCLRQGILRELWLQGKCLEDELIILLTSQLNLLLMSKRECLITHLHPNISIHFLHTVLYTFPMVLTKRICLTIKSFFSWWSFPLFSWPQCLF